jgi:hydrogenase maturation protease
VVVDATAPHGHPGRVRVLRERDGWALPAPPVGSHALGLAEVLELARALAVLPAHLTVVGVEAGCLALGAGLSEPVRAGLPEAVAVVTGLLDGPA